MRILFIEPPKDFWFILGDYIPPPLGILTLASYLETHVKTVDIEVVDCQAEKLDWIGLEKRIKLLHPDIVAPSGLGTCNAYIAIRTVEIAKRIDPNIITIVGGQHFTALSKESLEAHPHLDIIIRGEGEQTLSELIRVLDDSKPLMDVEGLSFRSQGEILHTPDRSLICDLDSLPFPAYHFVKDYMKQYYFALMQDQDVPFGIIEGSRGCYYTCSYCSQSRFWKNTHRLKTAERIVNELEYLYTKYGTRFFWLADDNFNLGDRVNDFCDIIIKRGLSNKITWFCQTRYDDIVNNKDLLPKMRKAGNIWMLTGFDNPNEAALSTFHRKDLNRTDAKKAVDLLRQNNIFSQGMFILGERSDSHESIQALRKYADWLDPDIATFMTLTPFPGTETYDVAQLNGWIEDTNFSNYDMIHAIMPTEHLTREEVQKELYECYRAFFGNWKRRNQGVFSSNPIKKRTYLFLAKKAIMTGLSSLFR